MIPFRKIVFPVDYTDACAGLVPYVKHMAEHFSAEITTVHAYVLPAVFYGYGEMAAVDFEWPAVEAAERRRLDEFTSQAFPGQKVAAIIGTGGAAEVIERVVREQGADLLMMPTRSRGPLRRLLLGSVTAKVMHDLSCAVWTGVHDVVTGYEARVPYHSILCAVGWDEAAPVVIQNAAALAKSFNAKLTVVHAAETPPSSIGIDVATYRAQVLEAGREHLTKLLRDCDVDVESTVIEGSIIDSIREEALRTRADLVVVGRGHARDTMGTFWSRLYGIVRESPCPVLSV